MTKEPQKKTYNAGRWFSPSTHHPRCSHPPSSPLSSILHSLNLLLVCSPLLLSDWIKYVSGTNRPLCCFSGQPCHMSAAISGTCLSDPPEPACSYCLNMLLSAEQVRGHGEWWRVFSTYSVVCGFTSFYVERQRFKWVLVWMECAFTSAHLGAAPADV